MTLKAAKNRPPTRNANGEYTVPGLASGEDEVEFISAQYVTQYYKNASSLADASPVTVKAGKEETTSEINAELMAAAPPEKAKSPVVKGTVAVGQTLTCSSAWTGTPTPEEFTYRWLKNGVTEIAGATKETYNVTSVDERHALGLRSHSQKQRRRKIGAEPCHPDGFGDKAGEYDSARDKRDGGGGADAHLLARNMGKLSGGLHLQVAA